MKKKKWLIAIAGIIAIGIVVVALGLKYFPLNKVMSIPSSSETEFANPQKIHSQAPHSLYFDFEVIPDKNMPKDFYKGIAHSGQYSAKAFGQNSYGAAIERTVKEIGVENLKAISLSTWVYVFPTSKQVTATLVFAASNDLGVNICWKGVTLTGPGIPTGKWFKISGNIDLSDIVFKPDYKLKIYFWNNSPTDILVDDYYIIFGGPVERRGDSTLVDMTKGSTCSGRLNYPPFPTFFLEREKSLGKARELSASDTFLAGDFLVEAGGQDELLVIKHGARPYLMTICPDAPGMKKISCQFPADALSFFSNGKIRKGKFIGGQGEQILITSEKGLLLGRFSNVKAPCSITSPAEITFNTIWKTGNTQMSGIPMGKTDLVFPGDFNKDGISELLILTDRGYWKMMQFDQGIKEDWKIIAEGDRSPVQEWNPSVFDITMTIDWFLPEINQDIILTVVKNKGTGLYDYSLRWFNQASGKFESRFPEKQGFFGKTIGLDTLKPTDRFFIENSGPARNRVVFRYNRDWRFDLKHMRFNDSTFQILGNIDFHGFDKDYNPKYYEFLQIIPGKFSTPSGTALLVIGSNRKELKILPDFMELYSLPLKQPE